ncbi:DNA polymerase IV [Promethearchaeum syntrophicum]|uniref:DNA polymerase IV n=1 Tax=Promethearchaeum syntrophicum TaxID=2594042 RepID=A0A5B9DAJ1_9ARCH|nr:DNA polymerase IV [Candidatus Prometheoarchaeum syntrophicum]QEE16112.1 DNA polymerase IV [Candidatus Prometheoarchaeum syntrophicum]
MDRIIFHVDLDCFFAAVEILDHPEYKGFPVITGADPKKGKGRGVVTTCSYEAREFGLHSGMPISKAYHLCPHGIYVKSNFGRIREISSQVMKILDKYSPVFQQVGSDEAYLDMSEIAIDMNHANEIAKKIKDEVQSEVGITCSIGVAFTKSLAKIGSDCNKPNGITIINPDNYKTILSPLKITRIPGIGKKSKIYYEKHGFQLIGDFLKIPKHKMIAKFGDRGRWIYNLINGLEERKVHDSSYFYHRKSISKERTFYEDTDDYQEILSKITDLNDKIHDILEKKGILYRTISLKIRFKGYETYLRSKSFTSAIRNKQKALEVVLDLYQEFFKKKKKIRLIGLKFSNLKETVKTNQKKILDYVKNV